MSKCITMQGGVVNKFIGDAVMAIFGAPIEDEQHASRAVEAGFQMIAAREKLNQDLKIQGFPAIHSGIGIHSGLVLSGNIGSIDRLEYTVIGDTVNQSSRIESLCKRLKHDFLISSATYELITPELQKYCEYRRKATVKGKNKQIKIYAVNHN